MGRRLIGVRSLPPAVKVHQRYLFNCRCQSYYHYNRKCTNGHACTPCQSIQEIDPTQCPTEKHIDVQVIVDFSLLLLPLLVMASLWSFNDLYSREYCSSRGADASAATHSYCLGNPNKNLCRMDV